jgi:hypothetical protein
VILHLRCYLNQLLHRRLNQLLHRRLPLDDAAAGLSPPPPSRWPPLFVVELAAGVPSVG